MGQFRHGLVVQEVGNDERIHGGPAEQRIQVHRRVALGHGGHQLVLGVGHLVHLRAGVLGGTLVLLDIDQIVRYFGPVVQVQLHAAVGDDAAGVNLSQAVHDGRPQGIVPAQVQALDILHHRGRNLL